MFDISEKLIVEQPDEFLECLKSAGKILHGRRLVLVHRTRRDRVSVAFLVQGPCGLFDCLSNLKVPCGPKAGREHGGRGF